jgi:hypothetical protein
MKLFLLSVFGLGVTMSVTAPTVLNKFDGEFAKIKELLAMSEHAMKGMLCDGDAYSIASSEFSPGKLCTPEPKEGLRNVHVQPSCGVQSGARGLTSEAEWRKMFPNPVGYSR